MLGAKYMIFIWVIAGNGPRFIQKKLSNAKLRVVKFCSEEPLLVFNILSAIEISQSLIGL